MSEKKNELELGGRFIGPLQKLNCLLFFINARKLHTTGTIKINTESIHQIMII